MNRRVAPWLLCGLLACGNPGSAPSTGMAGRDGQGVVLCFSKQLAVWVQVRATPASRSEGWGAGIPAPVLVSYPSRGFNPVFTRRNEGLVVAWIDGDRVVQTQRASHEDEHLSPVQEVTAALVVPGGWNLGFAAGDVVRFVGAQ